MARAGSATAVLLATGTGHQRLSAPDWLAGSVPTWRPELDFSVDGGAVVSTALAAGGACGVITSGRHGMLDGALAPGRPGDGVVAWNNFPLTPPSPGATLVLGSGPTMATAPAPGSHSVAVWESSGRVSSEWRRTQLISVPSGR